MKVLKQIAFWLMVILTMALLYQGLLGSFGAALFLVILLLPGVVFTVYALQRWRSQKSKLRWLHFFYLLLFSLFIEWIGVITAYYFIFELQFENLPKVLINPVFLWIILGFFAFLHDRFLALKPNVEKPNDGPLWFELVSERKRIRLDLNKLRYIESSNEQCILHLLDEDFPTRERISKLEERLPPPFLRVHRSYIINPDLAMGLSKTSIQFADAEISVSRSYKDRVEAYLQKLEKPPKEQP
ncbi:MAG: LytTR family DNA-binding domain-containing protein [Croceimicrobium sp.]